MAKQEFWKDIIFPGNVVDVRSIGPEGIIVPSGTTIERPSSPIDGTIRYNTTTNALEVFQNTAWASFTTSAISGETNTASNLGAGQGVFASKSGVDLRFKSLIAGTNVTIGSNANELIINSSSSGETNTASNVGTGAGIFNIKSGVDLTFRTLSSLTSDLTITENGNNIEFNIPAGLGEVNTASNTGGGNAIWKDKVSSNLRFRTLINTVNQIAITQNSDTLTIGIADNPVLPGGASVIVPIGASAAEPAPSNGMLRYDTTLNAFRMVVNGSWVTISDTSSILLLSGGTMTGNLTLGAGVDLIGGVGSQIQLQDNIILTSGADIDMSAGGSIIMQASETVDGRDVSVDGATLDNINQTGVFGIVSRTADSNTFTLRTITGTTDEIDITNGNGVSGNPTISIASNPVLTGNGSITIPTGTTAQQPGSPAIGMVRFNTTDTNIEYHTGVSWARPVTTIAGVVTSGSFTMNGGTIDGRNLVNDGIIIDQINAITNNTGVVVKSGDELVTRLILSDITNNALGISILNGNGSNAISVGLDVTGLSANTSLTDADELIVYTDSSSTNQKTDIASMKQVFGDGPCHVSVSAAALSTGVNAPIALSIATAADFDTHSRFDDGNDTYTPVAGIYSMTIHVLLDNTAIAGNYVIAFRKNGVNIGNTLIISGDATNSYTGTVTDIFEANGTDVFTVSVDNQSGSASAIASLIFSAHRVY